MKSTADALIDRVRAVAMALPDTTEKLSHGEPSFFVRGRMFATFDNNHHGSGRIAVICNAPPGARESLIEGDPELFFIPPYFGKTDWFGVHLDRGLGWNVIGDLVKQAYATSAAKTRRA